MRQLLLLIILLVGCAPFALAQKTSPDEPPKYEWFAGYSVIGEVIADNGRTLTQYGSNTGLETSLTRTLSKHWGIKGDFSAHFGTSRGRGSFGQPFATTPGTTVNGDLAFEHRLFNFLIGPELKARNSTRLTPFAHALVGAAHSRGEVRITFPTSTGLIKVSDTGVALALGGGLDISASERLGFRASMDYNPVYAGAKVTDPRDRRDYVRISLGIIFH